ncbi:MAG: DUF481 domain-containing protein, partial [Planctomycetota bacterium]|nr:DUF481 domain-containing protein [Planctomycetota bacterium]
MFFVTALLLTFCPLQDKSDRVVLENGDVVSGKVIDAKSGTLKLKTDYAKEIKVEMKKVRKITTSKPVWIQKKSGELFFGNLSSDEEGRVRITRTAPDEEAIFAWSSVRAINPPLGPRYHAKVELGSDLQSGNTNQTSLSLRLDAQRSTDQDDLMFLFRWNYAEEDHSMTKRNLFLSLEYDYSVYNELEREQIDTVYESTYLYLSTEFFSDPFRSIDYRTIMGLGAGLKPISEKDLFFSVEGGLAYLFEENTDGTDDGYITTRINSKVKWKPWEPV